MFKIDGCEIGQNYPPYIIAEISANHNGKIENAFDIIDMAKRAGANAIKMQTYTPDTITLNSRKPDFQINDGLWAGKTLYELYSEAYTPWEWHNELFEYAKSKTYSLGSYSPTYSPWSLVNWMFPSEKYLIPAATVLISFNL